MSTLREMILADIATRLVNTTPAGTNVFRSRVTALARGELPAIVIKPKSENVDSAQGMAVRNLGIEIEVHVRGEVPDLLADPTISAVHSILFADRTLGGKCASVIERATSWDFADADQAAGLITLSYDIVYATSTVNLSGKPR